MSNLDYYGKDFFENKVPEVISELRRIADALEKTEATPAVADVLKSNTSKKGFLPKCIFVCYEENSVELIMMPEMLATCMLQHILHRQRNGQSYHWQMHPQTAFIP